MAVPLLAAGQWLCACQVLSGLSELQAKPEDAELAQATQPVAPEDPVATSDAPGASLDGGADAGSLPSGNVGNKDEGSEQKNESEPEEKQARSTMDAGAVDGGDLRDPSGPGGATNVGPIAGAAGAAMAPSAPAIAGTGGSPGLPVTGIAGAGGSGGGAPDDEPVCMYPNAALRCSVTQQCGCSTNQNCAVENAQVVCIAAGPSGENQYCRETRDCAIGYQCANNACLKLCDAKQPDCDGGAACVQLFWGTQPVPGVFICGSACNPVDPQRADGELNACGAGLLCSWWDDGTFCSYSNRATRRHGEFCADQYDCAPGYACSASATCAKWCASDSDCPASFSCALDSPVVMGQKSFGMCKPNCLDRNERICGLTTQCGCDANHTCDTWLNDDHDVVHECRPLGTVGLYQSCNDAYDCGRGAQCVGSECRPVCLTDLDCARYSICQFSYFDDAPLTPAGSTCRRPCDPADPYNTHGQYGSCDSGNACDVSSDGISYCRSADLRAGAGSVCDGNSDCAVGYTCTSDDYCVALCRGDSDCAAGSCRAFATAQYAADVEWGYCASP